MHCPQCNFEQPDGNASCTMCGVIFARLNKPSWDEVGRGPDPLAARVVDQKAWINLGIGFGVACLICVSPFVKAMFGGLSILIHEMGHAAFGWLFGHPSIPAFDLRHGGGITMIPDPSTALLVCIYLGWASLFVVFRRNRLTLVVLAVSLTLYALCAHTRLGDLIILAMGHGTELVIGALFLYRALSGKAIVNPAERPLYAICGWFLTLNCLSFAFGLTFNMTDRIRYYFGKGGHAHDFVRIADRFLHVHLSVVSFLFLLACLLPPIVAFIAYRYQARIYCVIDRILERG